MKEKKKKKKRRCYLTDLWTGSSLHSSPIVLRLFYSLQMTDWWAQSAASWPTKRCEEMSEWMIMKMYYFSILCISYIFGSTLDIHNVPNAFNSMKFTIIILCVRLHTNDNFILIIWKPTINSGSHCIELKWKNCCFSISDRWRDSMTMCQRTLTCLSINVSATLIHQTQNECIISLFHVFFVFFFFSMLSSLTWQCSA